MVKPAVHAVGVAGRARRRARRGDADEAGAQHAALHPLRRRVRGAEACRGGGYQPAGPRQAWCGTPTRTAAAPARSCSATTRNRWRPDHFLYDPFVHTRGSGREGSEPGARARRGRRCRSAAGRGRAWRTWRPGSACRTRIDHEGVSMDELRKKGLEKMNEVYGWEMPDMPGEYFALTVDHLFGTIWTSARAVDARPADDDADRRAGRPGHGGPGRKSRPTRSCTTRR